jgi:hypothetical protein
VFGKCIQGQYTGEEREIGGTVIIISKSRDVPDGIFYRILPDSACRIPDI